MKRIVLILGAMALALPVLSQLPQSWVDCLDVVVLPGGYVRVSGGVAAVTPTPTAEPTAEPTEEPTEVPTEEPTVEPTEEPTEVPTVEPTEEPTEVPTEQPTEVPTEQPTPLPAGETYTLCLVLNSDWSAVDQYDCSECLATVEVMPVGGVFADVLLGPIPEPGEFDVLLLEGSCGGTLPLLASDDAGAEPAVVASLEAQGVPSILVPAILLLLTLLALSGAILLRGK